MTKNFKRWKFNIQIAWNVLYYWIWNFYLSNKIFSCCHFHSVDIINIFWSIFNVSFDPLILFIITQELADMKLQVNILVRSKWAGSDHLTTKLEGILKRIAFIIRIKVMTTIAHVFKYFFVSLYVGIFDEFPICSGKVQCWQV